MSGNITIPTGTLDVAGAGATGNGGTIDISGRDFVSPGQAPSPCRLMPQAPAMAA
ncbi:MAG: hypothetical protein IPO31_10950 [Candidatus Obscuribacter sp.]|nr:hypothetical protein [Candidatus Obscuribacter sp.]